MQHKERGEERDLRFQPYQFSKNFRTSGRGTHADFILSGDALCRIYGSNTLADHVARLLRDVVAQAAASLAQDESNSDANSS